MSNKTLQMFEVNKKTGGALDVFRGALDIF